MSEIDPGKQDAALSKAEIERVCVRNLLESSEERLFFKDSESRFLTVSAGFVKALGGGASIEDLIGKSDFDLFSRSHAVEAFEDEQHIIRTGEAIVGKLERETFHYRPDGWVATTKLALRDDDGEIIGTFGISRDVTEQVEAQQALAYQLHDPVTGLVNRLALMDRLAQALVALERHDGQLALLLIDLDDFKTVNDAVGYEVGDRVLTEIGGRLQRIGRRSDTVARFGGDEFVLMCTELRCENDVRLIGDRIMRALRQPLKNGHELTVTGSVAAVTTSVPVADVGELMEQAQLAMRAAKRAG